VNSGYKTFAVLGGGIFEPTIGGRSGIGGGMALLFAFLVGVLAGLRSLTPPAATAWVVRADWLHLPHEPEGTARLYNGSSILNKMSQIWRDAAFFPARA